MRVPAWLVAGSGRQDRDETVFGIPILGQLAGTLARQGIPAVIATLRQVMDQTAIMFTKNFYSALVEGASVEAAMYQTRTALAIEQEDWSVGHCTIGLTNRLSFDFPSASGQP